MGGTCVYEPTRTDGKLENAEFSFYFWPLVGLLPAIFGSRSVYHIICYENQQLVAAKSGGNYLDLTMLKAFCGNYLKVSKESLSLYMKFM